MINKDYFRKKFNRLYYPKKDNVSLPQIVMLEPTNICNLKCSMCYVQQNLRNHNSLSLTEFQNIINQFPKIKELIFCGIGEPLLNKDLFCMINEARNRKIPFINLVTNGKLLNPDISEMIIQSKINWIQISIHSFNPEIFCKIRNEDAANLENLKRNIKRLIAIKKELASPLKVSCNAVINRFNYGDLTEFVRYANDLGIDRVEFIQMTTANNNLKDISAPLNHMARIAKEIRRQARKLNIEVSFLSGNYYGRCYQLWEFIMIHADGNISPCNGIFPTENIGLGNILDRPLREIWNCEKYQKLREVVCQGKLENCRYCECGYLLEGRNYRWIKNYYFRPLKRMVSPKLKNAIRKLI